MLVLMCQAAGQRYAVDARAVAQVVPRVWLEAVAGAPEWLAGLCVCRGQVVPVVDLCRLIAERPCPRRWSNRVLLLPVPLGESSRLCGLLVESATTATLPVAGADADATRVSPWGQVLLDEQGVYQLLDLRRLFSRERLDRLFPAATEQA